MSRRGRRGRISRWEHRSGECQSPTWQTTQTWPRAGDDGGCCSPCSAERDSSAGGWAWWTDRRYQSAMEEIESEIVAGRYAIACRNLNKLLSWKADPNGGIVYLLGSCELARGRNQAAGEAWARVVPGSAFSETSDPGADASAPGIRATRRRPSGSSTTPPLIPAMIGRPCSCCSCRSSASRAASMKPSSSIEDRWEHLNAPGEGALEPAIKLVRQHIDLTLKAAPVETIRAFLDQAAQARARRRSRLAGSSEPGDPNRRLRRGRALARCLPAAPSGGCPGLARPAELGHRDQPDRRRETGHDAHAGRASRIRPGSIGSTPGSPPIGAMSPTERRELELLVAADPADVTALGRLAELAEKTVSPPEPPSSRARKPISTGCSPATGDCTAGNSPFATPRNWPVWPSSSADGSKPWHF